MSNVAQYIGELVEGSVDLRLVEERLPTEQDVEHYDRSKAPDVFSLEHHLLKYLDEPGRLAQFSEIVQHLRQTRVDCMRVTALHPKELLKDGRMRKIIRAHLRQGGISHAESRYQRNEMRRSSWLLAEAGLVVPYVERMNAQSTGTEILAFLNEARRKLDLTLKNLEDYEVMYLTDCLLEKLKWI